MEKSILLFAFLLFIAGCTVPQQNTITVSIGQTVEFKGAEFRVKDIIDSRCPSDVQCPWAGEVKVILESKGKELSLTLPGQETAEIGNVEITLVSVEPYPSTKNPIRKEDYRIKLRIKG